jgi:hypothetical protein
MLRICVACTWLGAVVGCAPVNPSAAAVVGHWTVEWTCGTETLDLNRDGTYRYLIAFAAGGRATDSGRWSLTPKTETLSGAKIVLEHALDACSAFGEKQSLRHDRELEAIWEWGKTRLIFNPDVPGFTRE